jgi:hypothetical protein
MDSISILASFKNPFFKWHFEIYKLALVPGNQSDSQEGVFIGLANLM